MAGLVNPPQNRWSMDISLQRLKSVSKRVSQVHSNIVRVRSVFCRTRSGAGGIAENSTESCWNCGKSRQFPNGSFWVRLPSSSFSYSEKCQGMFDVDFYKIRKNEVGLAGLMKRFHLQVLHVREDQGAVRHFKHVADIGFGSSAAKTIQRRHSAIVGISGRGERPQAERSCVR